MNGRVPGKRMLARQIETDFTGGAKEEPSGCPRGTGHQNRRSPAPCRSPMEFGITSLTRWRLFQVAPVCGRSSDIRQRLGENDERAPMRKDRSGSPRSSAGCCGSAACRSANRACPPLGRGSEKDRGDRNKTNGSEREASEMRMMGPHRHFSPILQIWTRRSARTDAGWRRFSAVKMRGPC